MFGDADNATNHVTANTNDYVTADHFTAARILVVLYNL